MLPAAAVANRSPNVLSRGNVDTAVSWRSFLVGLECSACHQAYAADLPRHVCQTCDQPLFARYDLAHLRQSVDPDVFGARPWDIWRYRELLPVRGAANAVSLGEGLTPLLYLGSDLRRTVGLERGTLAIKDEGRNPTASFKARGMAVALSRAREQGVHAVALSTTGNAGVAAAAYGAALGMEVHVAMPAEAPRERQNAVTLYGADLVLIDGPQDAVENAMNAMAAQRGWFTISSFQEPYRVEGKKTFGLELAEQAGWGQDCMPDVIVYPTGGGTGFVAMWKAFAELAELGWIGPRVPRMVAVQASGCAPIVRAFERRESHAERWSSPSTSAAGIRVTATRGDRLILECIVHSGGTAVAVDEQAIDQARQSVPRQCGIGMSAEGAAAWAALAELRRTGFLAGDERVVVFNTAAAPNHE